MLYGPWMRPAMTILIVFTNVFFLLAYTMFFGKQIDQLVCRTGKFNECGSHNLYSLIIVIALLPLVYQRRLNFIGYFSFITLCATFVAVIIIIVISGIIASKSVDENNNDYHLDMTEE
jgi:amino acid permease